MRFFGSAARALYTATVEKVFTSSGAKSVSSTPVVERIEDDCVIIDYKPKEVKRVELDKSVDFILDSRVDPKVLLVEFEDFDDKNGEEEDDGFSIDGIEVEDDEVVDTSINPVTFRQAKSIFEEDEPLYSNGNNDIKYPSNGRFNMNDIISGKFHSNFEYNGDRNVVDAVINKVTGFQQANSVIEENNIANSDHKEEALYESVYPEEEMYTRSQALKIVQDFEINHPKEMGEFGLMVCSVTFNDTQHDAQQCDVQQHEYDVPIDDFN